MTKAQFGLPLPMYPNKVTFHVPLKSCGAFVFRPCSLSMFGLQSKLGEKGQFCNLGATFQREVVLKTIRF